MDRNVISGLNVVVVGLGGIFYAASVALRGLLDQYAPSAGVIVMDDDRIERRNWTRQWHGTPEGVSKVRVALERLSVGAEPMRPVIEVDDRFRADTRLDELLGDLPGNNPRTLVLCLPDNDGARVSVAKECAAYARRKPARVVSITCGCDMDKGQALMGIYDKPGPLMNLLKRHPDIGEAAPGAGAGPCSVNQQSLYSNVMTATMLTICVKYALTTPNLWSEAKPVGLEAYWTQPDHIHPSDVRKPEMWVSEVEC